ncbi:hypothetical protein ACFO3K_08520 [Cellulomonas algicola]|uniref:hypothetical protein n=1 Tax=Cellulomonas algicola TaxID=2071633 RepID=UPI001C3FD231|nr:hypothetical protein [Cellulomonas algicola]
MEFPTDVQVALVGLGGAFLGGLLTVGWQAISTALSNRRADKEARRAERKDLYIEALWGLRAVRREMRESLFAEQRAHAEGETHVPPDPAEWWKLERLVFEVGLLGDTGVFEALNDAAETYREWVMSLGSTEGDVITWSVIEPKMNALEPPLRRAIRDDLGID